MRNGRWVNVHSGEIIAGTDLAIVADANETLAALDALACLAEVEHAHGHTEFAVTYLRHATQAMGMEPFKASLYDTEDAQDAA